MRDVSGRRRSNINGRGRGRSRARGRATNNDPLSEIRLWNGLGYSNAKTFIPNEAHQVTHTAPTSTLHAIIVVRNIVLVLILIISC